MIYKVAETFDSIQGEASFAGARMFFIRLAGCNVGKYIEPESDDLKALRVLNPKHSVCTSYIGNSFLCDTDYHSAKTVTERELIEESIPYSPIVCITGGEPFLWDLAALVDGLHDASKKVHVETSGTLLIDNYDIDHIVCSPKEGFKPANLSTINEWKFVVDKSMGQPVEVAKKITDFIRYAASKKVYIQPVGGITTIDDENVKYAYEVIKCSKAPWRLSLQMHKILNMR